jgi:hypothetical protein
MGYIRLGRLFGGGREMGTLWLKVGYTKMGFKRPDNMTLKMEGRRCDSIS